jgi:rubrerythrin
MAPIEPVHANEPGRQPPVATRRGLLSCAGGAAAGLVLTACGGGDDGAAPARGTSRARDVEIVNYALTLEYLEVQLYDRAVDSGFFSGEELDLLKRFRAHERQHIDALTAAVGKLGGTPVGEPEGEFDADDRVAFLKLAQRLENLGAAAYLGQAHRIDDDEILAAVLSIHSVEARHAAVLNTILEKDIAPTGAFGKPATMAEVLPVANLFVSK